MEKIDISFSVFYALAFYLKSQDRSVTSVGHQLFRFLRSVLLRTQHSRFPTKQELPGTKALPLPSLWCKAKGSFGSFMGCPSGCSRSRLTDGLPPCTAGATSPVSPEELAQAWSRLRLTGRAVLAPSHRAPMRPSEKQPQSSHGAHLTCHQSLHTFLMGKWGFI